MSEYVGSVYVKVLPDSRGFTPELDRQIASQSPRVQSLLQRSGLDKSLKSYDKTSRDLIATQNALATAEAAAAVETEKLGRAHENVAIHAHRSQIAGFTIRGTTLGIGAAAVIGAEGLRKLAEGLKVVGDQADTTSGRLRNAAAAAITGDFATAAQRIGEAAAGTSLEGAAADRARKAALEHETQINAGIEAARTLLDLREKAAKAEGQVGTAAGATRFQLEQQLRIANAVFAALTPAQRRIGAAQFGLGPNLENRVRVAPTDTSRASDFELNTLRAQQTKSLANDRRLFEDRRTFLQGQVKFLENAGAHSQAAKDRLKTLYGQLDSVEGQIQSLDDQAAQKRAERLQARIALETTNIQIQQANARTDAQENAATAADAAAARRNAANKNLSLQDRASERLRAAQDERTIFENEKQAAAAAKAERDRLAAEAKRKADEAIAAEKQRRAEAAQQYRADISLAESKLQLGVQRAQLTEKSLKDDRVAVRALIRFYREQARDFKLTDAERLNFRSQAVGAQLQLKSLNANTNAAPRSSASDFFNEAASQFRSFGSNIATKGGILSGQDARGAFAARALGRGQSIAEAMAQQAQQTRTSQLTEQQKSNVYLKTIADRLTYGGATKDPPAKAIGKARRGAHTAQPAV